MKLFSKQERQGIRKLIEVKISTKNVEGEKMHGEKSKNR